MQVTKNKKPTPTSAPATDLRKLTPEAIEAIRQTVLHELAVNNTDVSMRQLIRASGVSPKTMYKYFGNRDQVLLACIADDLDVLRAHLDSAVDSAPDEVLPRLFAFGQAFAQFYQTHVDVARIVFLLIPARHWMLDPLFTQAHVRGRFQQLLGAGLPGTPREQRTLIDFFLGGVQRIVVQWLLEGASADPNDDLWQRMRPLMPVWERILLPEGDQAKF